MVYEERIKALKEKRKLYHVRQAELASSVGVEKTYISKIENGKERASEELLEKIEDALKKYDPEQPLEILFDYVRIRFPTDDVREVINEIMQLKTEYFLHEDHAFYGYAEQYILGDIVIMTSPDIKKGILLELKGKGCRQFEIYLNAQKRSWLDFFYLVEEHHGVFKRIDLAINDCTGILNIPELSKKTKNEECISKFRNFNRHESGELVKTDEKHRGEKGNTLYIGSMKSEIYFCLYEKDYEQYIKTGTPVKDAKIKNRFEIRLKNKRAELAIQDLMKHGNAGKTAFSIINHYVRFVDKDKKKRRSEWKLNSEWKRFIGKENGEIRLTMEPEPYTIEKTYRWIDKQVIRSYIMLEELDEKQGTTIMFDMKQRAELTEKQKKIIEQQTTSAEELVF